jgi:hypothetical protein
MSSKAVEMSGDEDSTQSLTTAMRHNGNEYSPQHIKVFDRKWRDASQNLDPSRYVYVEFGSSKHPQHSPEWQECAKPTTHSLIAEYGAQALPSLLAPPDHR